MITQSVMNDSNPFAAPQASLTSADDLRLPLLPESQWGELDLRIASVDRRWSTIRIQLEGSIQAELCYNPIAAFGELLYLNGQLLLRIFNWGITQAVVPHVEFHLETASHSVPASIDVTVSAWRLLRLTSCSLTIANRMVYETS